MKIFLSVIDELYTFAIESLFRRQPVAGQTVSKVTTVVSDEEDFVSEEVRAELEDIKKILDDGLVEEIEVMDTTPEFRSIGDIAISVGLDSVEKSVEVPVVTVEKVAEQHSIQKNTVMYVGGSDTPIYKNPTREFDSVLARLPYGAMVMVLGQQGRWANVVHNDMNGWILRDDLLDRAAHVYPHFVSEEQH